MIALTHSVLNNPLKGWKYQLNRFKYIDLSKKKLDVSTHLLSEKHVHIH